ncbi:PAS domain-containing protein [Halorubrum ezzemoulense]|uniref:PAS domain-containing protein n=1 Tax=Halorubrum ezzemoulense TaxID=337243 RepID=UPI0034E0746A
MVPHNGAEKSTAEKIEPAIKQALDRESVVLELETEAATGERQRFVRAVLSPLWDDDGAVTGVVGSVHDLSEVRQREQQLQVPDRVLRLDILLRVNAEESRAVGVSGFQSSQWTTSPFGHG